MDNGKFLEICKKELYLDAYKKFENKCIEIQ